MISKACHKNDKQSLSQIGFMIKVNVKKQANYPVNSKKLKTSLQNFFHGQGIVSEAEVSVAIVSQAKMLEYGKTYMGEKGDKPHNVLSFTPDETRGKFAYPPDGKIHLGEIIICYPKMLEEAKYEGVLIDDKAIQLALHGAAHLMGIHHK
jgi:rRNA maturation RNase YbeY